MYPHTHTHRAAAPPQLAEMRRPRLLLWSYATRLRLTPSCATVCPHKLPCSLTARLQASCDSGVCKRRTVRRRWLMKRGTALAVRAVRIWHPDLALCTGVCHCRGCTQGAGGALRLMVSRLLLLMMCCMAAISRHACWPHKLHRC
jgi:hypothetical protein